MNTIVLDKTEQGGYIPVSVMSKLASDRKLFIYGELDINKAADICATLMFLSSQQATNDTITLFVSINMAHIKAVLMVIDCIENISSKIKVVCIGALDGFGTLLLAAADKSKMTINSRLSFSPLKLMPNLHQTNTAESLMKRAFEYDKRVYSILSKKMGLSLKDTKKVFEKPVFWSSKDALKHKLIDGIVSPKEEVIG